MNITRRRNAAATGLAALVVLTACGEDKPKGAAAATGTATPKATGTSKPSATKKPAATTKKPAGTKSAPVATATPDDATVAPPGTMTTVVYYVVDDADLGPRLAREFRRVPKSTGVVRAAVDAVLHLAPLDPDYKSLWPNTTKVLGVSVKGDTATVDLSNLVGAGASFESAAVDQIVWSVTAVASKVTKVRLLMNGKPAASGHLDLSKPVRRGPHTEVLLPVQITSPAHGVTVTRTPTVTGEATVFEASVSWSIVDVASKKVLDKGFVTASAGAPARGTWKFTGHLPESAVGKKVEIRAWEASAEDGRITHLDTKVVTVR